VRIWRVDWTFYLVGIDKKTLLDLEPFLFLEIERCWASDQFIYYIVQLLSSDCVESVCLTQFRSCKGELRYSLHICTQV